MINHNGLIAIIYHKIHRTEIHDVLLKSHNFHRSFVDAILTHTHVVAGNVKDHFQPLNFKNKNRIELSVVHQQAAKQQKQKK